MMQTLHWRDALIDLVELELEVQRCHFLRVKVLNFFSKFFYNFNCTTSANAWLIWDLPNSLRRFLLLDLSDLRLNLLTFLFEDLDLIGDFLI